MNSLASDDPMEIFDIADAAHKEIHDMWVRGGMKSDAELLQEAEDFDNHYVEAHDDE